MEFCLISLSLCNLALSKQELSLSSFLGLLMWHVHIPYHHCKVNWVVYKGQAHDWSWASFYGTPSSFQTTDNISQLWFSSDESVKKELRPHSFLRSTFRTLGRSSSSSPAWASGRCGPPPRPEPLPPMTSFVSSVSPFIEDLAAFNLCQSLAVSPVTCTSQWNSPSAVGISIFLFFYPSLSILPWMWPFWCLKDRYNNSRGHSLMDGSAFSQSPAIKNGPLMPVETGKGWRWQLHCSAALLKQVSRAALCHLH